MTKRESTYLERLKARRSVLAAELVLCPEGKLRKLVREEYRAIKWAIEMIERVVV